MANTIERVLDRVASSMLVIVIVTVITGLCGLVGITFAVPMISISVAV